MPVAFYLSIDVRVTHVLNNALESFLFKRAQYGKIVFTAFTNKKGCSKFTKYYFNKKKVINIISIHKQINFSAQMFFQKLIQASDGSRCKSDSVSCLPAPWCTTITDLNGCRTCECNSEFINEIVFSCPSYKATCYKAIAWNCELFLKNVDDCFFSPFFTYMNMYKFVKYLKKTRNSDKK